MVWYRAHESSWHQKAEDWGKHAMARLRKTTAELTDTRTQLEIARREVNRLITLNEEKENVSTAQRCRHVLVNCRCKFITAVLGGDMWDHDAYSTTDICPKEADLSSVAGAITRCGSPRYG